jgi:predicted transcriptional regulator of viral defense system
MLAWQVMSRRTSAPSRAAELPSVFRPRDLHRLDISRTGLRAMLRAGEVAQIGRGLYRNELAAVSELDTIATVCARAPQAIVCLLSALAIHDLGTQQPHAVWIAFDRKARTPRFDDIDVRVVRFSGALLQCGVTTLEAQGVTLRLTDPARTVVDCFRYRNKVGLDVAIEALRDALGKRVTTVDDIVRTAKTCRIYSVMKPFLQAVLG